MNKIITLGIAVVFSLSSLSAQTPEWISKRLRSDSFFYGRGEGITQEDAEISGREEIRLQLSSQVIGLIRSEDVGDGEIEAVDGMIASFFNDVKLRTAEVEDRYEADGLNYTLVRYPESSALIIAQTAVKRFQENHSVDPKTVINHFDEGAMIRAARLERVLYDAVAGNYGDDLFVSLKKNILTIQILNFAANRTNLTESQKQGLNALGAILVDEISDIDHESVVVSGHANPTGIKGEEDLLYRISFSRAKTMADILRGVGLEIDRVQGLGGSVLLGNTRTLEGRSLNRRVVIQVVLEL